MEKQSENTSSSSQFLKTDGGKTKSNAIEIPSISLPKGGGAIKGIDEKFSVNAVNGTASFSIALPFSPARGASPALSLAYNSGAGNGIFGLGWSLNLASIKRKTDKGLPQYIDESESDTFLFSEAEDLVSEFKRESDGSFSFDDNGDYIIKEKDLPDGSYKIRFYKPRIEGLFARIEKWTEKTTGIVKWRIITKDNLTTLFGWSGDTVICDPQDNTKIFEWLPEFVFDDKGNCAHYIYKKEDEIGFDVSLPHNRNRFKDGKITYTNLYLEKVLYGNKTPYKNFGDAFPAETDYVFKTIFDYGEYDKNSSFSEIKDWDFRTDAFSDYKAGFEIRTTRLCRRVLLFHHFRQDEYDGLVKSLNFEYDTASEKDFTFLKSFTACGYIKNAEDGTYTSKKLPSTEFEYQKHDWNKEVKFISEKDLVHSPIGLDEQQYQFTDLFNEGLAGILTEQADGWYYKHNLGEGRFEQARLVTPKPSFLGLGKQLRLSDLDADGGRQIVSYGVEPNGYFELNDDNEWQPFRNFQNIPNIDFSDANTRFLDLNGDGRPDIVITEDSVFNWYQSEGRNGFSKSTKCSKSFDEEAGPQIVFADSLQTVFLADMSGDGMTDIVRIRNGEVCYWANLGYGKFGSKVSMDNAPVFDHPDSFNPAFLRLADIDGSGTTDIIYLGKNKFTCWTNLSGNAFSSEPSFETDAFPEIDNCSEITVTDLLGSGVSCIVWSSPLPKDALKPLRYIDLTNSKKPHLMVSYKNNLGKEVSLEYTPSTKFYIDDKLAGKPWITKLHFPVHCISKIETVDKISGWRFVNFYKYHHGYYDHPEREFRGFGMVEQIDTEDFENPAKGDASNIVNEELHQPPVVSKTWFHTGAFTRREQILNQFAGEYWYEEMERRGFTAAHHEKPLPDARIISAPNTANAGIENLSAEEWREALRACKSMPLRSEVFSSSDSVKQFLTPYSVSTKNCVIELLQPKGKNKHAVFVVKESEAITYSYERNAEDPRIAHNLNIKLDEYGNVLESAAVVYPRVSAEIILPEETRREQDKTIIIYTQNEFTNDVSGDDTHRLRLAAEVKTFELKGVAKTGSFYAVKDFKNILTDAVEVAYHNTNFQPPTAAAQKRLIEHIRTYYYRNNLRECLPLGGLESLAIPCESFQLAYTPELIADIYGTKVSDALLLEQGKFTHTKGDVNWWIRSGITQFIEEAEAASDAQNRFYVPISYIDAYGAKTKVKFDEDYRLFIRETEDALKNVSSVDLFNFRTLSARRMRDINNNISEAISDELGLVKATALYGKGFDADNLDGLTESTGEAERNLVDDFFNVPDFVGADDSVRVTDSVRLTALGKNLLRNATARFVYDFDAFEKNGKPAWVASIMREEHFRDNPDSAVQLAFEYSNGLGKVVMKKVQAEPGLVEQTYVNGSIFTTTRINTAALTPKQLRWIGSGRTILNNKGNPVIQYEPYFSATHRYEDAKELVATGVALVMHYDALGRLIKTEMPDGTFSRTQFDSWKQIISDAGDTVLESSWYINRARRLIEDDEELIRAGKDPEKEKTAADKSFEYAETSGVLHFDTLGRPILSIEHNKNLITRADEFYQTKAGLDVEGNLRSVIDARRLPENDNRGNTVMQYKYDMLGNLVYQNSMDAGQRWLLVDILGNPLRTWDEREQEFQYFYDALHRPTDSKILGGDGTTALDNIFDKIIYGESLLLPDQSNKADLQSDNVLGQVIKHFDTGGVLLTPDYDFKGQPKFITRKLFRDYKSAANWTDANLVADLEAKEFIFTTKTDALGRITEQTAPDKSVITLSYNETGLLNAETVTQLAPDVTTIYIRDIDYNEKGQRNKIVYGNGVITEFNYDKETFRLKHLETKRQNGDPLQDLYYTFDAVGNITHIEDKNVPVTIFDNEITTGLSEYTYDALYRLVKATGRENDAVLSFNRADNWNDAPFMHRENPGNPAALRNYTQSYQYDQVGNISEMHHQATGNVWTRNYEYEKNNNRLKTTRVRSQTYAYTHNPKHGFITVMPHLEEIGWNFKEELVKTVRQKVNPENGTAETTYYQYDAQGQRIRKITENSAAAGAAPTKKEERIYVSGFELYKKHSGAHAGLERASLSLIDQGHRFAMIETRNEIDDDTEKRLVRYQLHNHLGSVSLELDGSPDAELISYEEYHPFGMTAYQANNAEIKAAAKRYRFTGMERDEETGFDYHSARYYVSWLGRWISADPVGIKGGINSYRYSNSNPIRFIDLTGYDPTPADVLLMRMIYQANSENPGGTYQLYIQNEQFRNVLAHYGIGVDGCLTERGFAGELNQLRDRWTNRYGLDIRSATGLTTYQDATTVVLAADARGNGYIGPRSIVERQIGTANFGYQLQVGNNIRGGIFGALGYMFGGDRGSYLGASMDGLLMATSATASHRQANQAISGTAPPPQGYTQGPVSRPTQPAPRTPAPTPAPPSLTRATLVLAPFGSSHQALITSARRYFNLPASPTSSRRTIVGVMFAENKTESIGIRSGIDGGPWGGTQRGGIPRGQGYGFTTGGPSQGNLATHVEGHAAAIMHQRGITNATLYVESNPCQICSRDLMDALPAGSTLTVVSPGGTTIFRSSHSR